jgi:DNA replication protein DnaC
MIKISEILHATTEEEKPKGNKLLKLESLLSIRMKKAFMASSESVCADFKATEQMRQNLNDLCTYFLGLDGNLSLNKGVYLVGDYGVGKSTLMKIFRQWLADWWPFSGNGFMITSVEEIIEHYKKENNLDKFTANTNEDKWPDPRHLLINEFGKELKDKIYGTEANHVMDNVMMLRYDLFQNSGKLTHITSNSMPHSDNKALMDRYVEMFNIVKMGGNSFRK